MDVFCLTEHSGLSCATCEGQKGWVEGGSLYQTLGPTFFHYQSPKICALTAPTQASKEACGDGMEGMAVHQMSMGV